MGAFEDVPCGQGTQAVRGVERIREGLVAAGIGPRDVEAWEGATQLAVLTGPAAAVAQAVAYAEGLSTDDLLTGPLAQVIVVAWLAGYRRGLADGGGAAP